MVRLDGKVVLITGASSGLGECTAIHLASLGCAGLLLTGRNADNLAKVQQQCVANGIDADKVHTVVADVTLEDDRQVIVQQLTNKFGRLDVLFNNAGVAPKKQASVIDGTLANYDLVMNTNVRAVVALTQLCLPMIIKSKGVIVNMSSVASVRPLPRSAFYAMSKAAIDTFTKCLAIEVAEFGVRVNAVNPGVIRTPIYEHGGLDKQQVEQLYKKAIDHHALGRIGEPIEVAKAVAFLASDDASFTTGDTLLVDGGRALVTPK